MTLKKVSTISWVVKILLGESAEKLLHALLITQISKEDDTDFLILTEFSICAIRS